MEDKKCSSQCNGCTNMRTIICVWNQAIGNGVHRMVAPVVCNIVFTLWAWIEVYKMEHNYELINKMFFNTGDKLWDALINGSAVVATLICTAFFLLALVMLNFKRLVQCWLYIACTAILFAVSGGFFYDLLLKFLPDPEEKEFALLGFGTSLFGWIGIAAFFFDVFPSFVHQFYVIFNCSLVSLLYLRILPGYTAWAVLAALVFWDLFAVLTPYGPLRIVQDKAKDYGADILRFLMFTSTNGKDSDEIDTDSTDKDTDSTDKDTSSSYESDNSDCSSGSDSQSSDNMVVDSSVKKITKKAKETKTAADALDDDSARLGMGDFVFYGVLAGAAASNGSLLGTLAAVFGVVYGLIITFTIPFNTKYTVPAIPISVCLGTFYHFVAIYVESFFY